MSSGFTLISWKPVLRSIFENTRAWPSLSSISSIRGIGAFFCYPIEGAVVNHTSELSFLHHKKQ